MAMVHPPSRFSSRRSPLDSATYRTLVRIFSLCSKDSQQQTPNPSVDSAEESRHGGAAKGAAIAADSLREPADDANPRPSSPQPAAGESGGGKGKEEGRPCADGGIETDCERLIDCSADNQADATVQAQIGSSGHERAGQEIDAGVLVSKPTYESDTNKEKSSECLNGEAVEAAAFDKNANVREIGDGTEREACINSGPFVDEHVAEVSLEEGEIEVEVAEGGEIPNEVEDSNQLEDLVHDDGDKELDEGLASEGFRKYGSSILIHGHPPRDEIHFENRSLVSYEGLNEFVNDGSSKSKKKKNCSDASGSDAECKTSLTEVVEGHVKKKRASLTDERKAKRKIAKKRKRAQKEREQGVKRLKIQPEIKPKEVQVCKFYSHGKCRQGDKCKFSHDAIPLTKSTPCKHFVYDSCLKGDDCPYDHQLSNYLCHNFRDKGICDRGDRCKFSHKVPVIEGTAAVAAAAASKPDAVPSPCNSNLVKQTPANRTSFSATDQLKSIPAPRLQFSVDKPAAGKGAVPMPNGVRFVTFGKGPSGNADKQKSDQQKKEKSMVAAQKNVSFPGPKSLPTAPNACKISSSGGLQTEVSEASKLLEEFLFCGLS